MWKELKRCVWKDPPPQEVVHQEVVHAAGDNQKVLHAVPDDAPDTNNNTISTAMAGVTDMLHALAKEKMDQKTPMTLEDVLFTIEEMEAMCVDLEWGCAYHKQKKDTARGNMPHVTKVRQVAKTKATQEAATAYKASLLWNVKYHDEVIARDNRTLSYVKKCMALLEEDELL